MQIRDISAELDQVSCRLTSSNFLRRPCKYFTSKIAQTGRVMT